MVLRAVVVLPLLLMIMCHGVVIASMGSVTNVDAKRNNTIAFCHYSHTAWCEKHLEEINFCLVWVVPVHRE